jgi:myo-inositol-1(or 4)-monophosphatase
MHPMLNVAVKAARRASSLINRASMDIDTVRVGNKGPGDYVTEVDHAVERDLIQTLQQAYPQHGFLAEESGLSGNEASPYRWIIDPLDGTTNFIHGLPHYAVSLALTFNGEVTVACVYQPATNELFTAAKGEGAYLNSRRLRVSRRGHFHEALLATSSPNQLLIRKPALVTLQGELNVATSGVRRMGSAVLDMAYLAAGRIDGYYGAGLQPWDIATGVLLVKEAGGLIADGNGEQRFMELGSVIAGNPKIFAQLLPRVQPVLAQATASPAAAGTDGGAVESAAPAEPTAVAPPAKPVGRATLKRAAKKV